MDERATDELIKVLRRAADIIEAQRVNPDSRFVDNAKRVLQKTSNWVRDIEYHERRLTMPATNTQDKHQPRPSNVIGYLYQP